MDAGLLEATRVEALHARFAHSGIVLDRGDPYGCFILVLFFEFSNGFHDTANAVATVIYTNSLMPVVAVIWSGVMNFSGGIAVAYALVELIPPDVLSPPDGSLAAGMLVSIFVTARPRIKSAGRLSSCNRRQRSSTDPAMRPKDKARRRRGPSSIGFRKYPL
jgi:Phosphate transporter family